MSRLDTVPPGMVETLDCFLCGKPVSITAGVFWSGETGQIVLHTHCTIHLCRALLQDVEGR